MGHRAEAKAQLPAQDARRVAHPLIIVTLISMMIPASFDLGGLYMTPMRLLYVFTVPVLAIRWVLGRYGRLQVSDYLMMGFLLWMAVTVGKHHPSQLVTFTGSTGLTILGGYLTARATIRTAADFQAFVRFLTGLIVLVLMPLALYESVSRDGSLVLKWIAALPYFEAYHDSQYCCRMGLDRAQTVFIHPIHHGVFCSMAFALYFIGLTNSASFAKRVIVSTLVAVATFMSVSSGAVLVIALQLALVAYAIMFHKVPQQWRIMLIGTLICYVIIELLTQKFALFSISQRLSFNSWNVYIRGLLYNAGVDQVMKTPIFGFGYNRLPGLPFWMTGSVDNYWLQMAISHGIPGLLTGFGAFLYTMIFVGRQRFTKGSDLYYARISWTFVMIGLCFSLTTVAIWAEVQSMTFLMLGAGQFLFYAREPAEDEAPAPAVPVRGGAVYTRFPAGARPVRGRSGPLPARSRQA